MRYCFDIGTTKWFKAAPSETPSGRYGHSAIVDQKGRMWIFGGRGDKELVNDMFYLGLDDIDIAAGKWGSWTKVTTAGTPADRNMHSAVVYKNHMWIFGGSIGDECVCLPKKTFILGRET